MKNIDIDTLERKNIYPIPEHFFTEMQERVLEKISPSKAPIIDLPRRRKMLSYGWAASLVFLVGLGTVLYFFTGNEEKINPEPKVVQHTKKAMNSSVEELSIPEETPNYVAQSGQKQISPVSKQEEYHLATAEQSLSTTEQILGSLSQDELHTLSKNIDADIYLDLYH